MLCVGSLDLLILLYPWVERWWSLCPRVDYKRASPGIGMWQSLPFLTSLCTQTPASCFFPFLSNLTSCRRYLACSMFLVWSSQPVPEALGKQDHPLQWKAARIKQTPLGSERFPTKGHGQVRAFTSGFIHFISAFPVFLESTSALKKW